MNDGQGNQGDKLGRPRGSPVQYTFTC